MYDRLKNLLSPLFIFCLILLIVNDFFLKATFHNALTGKLSDFCGLFIFPIFWSAVFLKHKIEVFAFSGIFFIFWKSEYSSGIIEILNTLFNIQRVVDPTDLIALPVLLCAWFYMEKGKHVVSNNSLVTRLTAFCVGAVTIFSFCATSQPRYVQSFEQPQYVLLQSAITPDSSLHEEFNFYKKGSLLVVKVNQLYISKPVKEDDYNKNRSLKDLDKDVLARITDRAGQMPDGKITSLSITTAQGEDSLRFNGGRLDGRFSRTKNGKLLIEGFYKMGLEDSTWTFKDSVRTNVVLRTFVNGEGTSIKQFRNSKLISSNGINTRKDTIRNTYIQISILTLLAISLIIWLVRNYRDKFTEKLKLKLIWELLLCFISPALVWLTHIGIQILQMDFDQDIFKTFASIIIVFLVTCPLMFAVVFGIKLRKEIDIVLYWLLFGVLCTIWTTYGTLIELSN